jgi:sarcosine oxidase subunit beta
MVPRHAEAVVIGGGARGASITYHLAKAGVDVVLVERHGLASGASGATFALINVSGKTPEHYTSLSLASADLYPDLEAELDTDLEYERQGNMIHVVEHESEVEAVQWFVRQQNRVPGVELQFLDAHDARELEPALSPHIVGATFCAADGHLNPFKLVHGYARAARRLGARIFTHTPVTGMVINNGRIEGVKTSDGVISTRTVVNAAGVHVPDIGEMLRVPIPVAACRGQVITTEALPRVLQRPVGSLRQTADGNILIGVTHDFVGYDQRVTYEAITQNVTRACRLFPVLKHLHGVRFWAGLRPWPIDGLPIMGPIPEVEGFLVAAGHSGITLAQITGKLIMEYMTTGATSIPLDPYRIHRFREVRYHFTLEAFHRFRQEYRPQSTVARETSQAIEAYV